MNALKSHQADGMTILRPREVELFETISKALMEYCCRRPPNGRTRVLLAEELCQDTGHPRGTPGGVVVQKSCAEIGQRGCQQLDDRRVSSAGDQT